MSSSKPEIEVVVCQMTSIDDVEANKKAMIKILSDLSNPDSLDLICFPENCLYMALEKDKDKVSFGLSDKVFEEFVDFAKKHKVALHLGSLPVDIYGQRYNASVLIKETGEISSPYQKIHLFDIDLESGESHRESEQYTAGTYPALSDIAGWRAGFSICFDLRFPELFLSYYLQGAEILMAPSAFTMPTGKAHWETLLRARAIEGQAYVLAAAQGGDHGGKRETFGHSMIIDPWGEVLSMATKEELVLRARLKKEDIKSVRKRVPMRQKEQAQN